MVSVRAVSEGLEDRLKDRASPGAGGILCVGCMMVSRFLLIVLDIVGIPRAQKTETVGKIC
jgi:hypothetical protein